MRLGRNHIIKEYGDKFAVLEDNVLNNGPKDTVTVHMQDMP
jgi:hypothetical protein